MRAFPLLVLVLACAPTALAVHEGPGHYEKTEECEIGTTTGGGGVTRGGTEGGACVTGNDPDAEGVAGDREDVVEEARPPLALATRAAVALAVLALVALAVVGWRRKRREE